MIWRGISANSRVCLDVRTKHQCHRYLVFATLRGIEVRFRRRARALVLASLAALVLLPPPTFAQGIGLISPNDRRALDVEADNGIEWRQDQSVYIARSNARATRGG